VGKVYVIGIGYKPLDKRARGIVLNAEIILASKRLQEVFERYDEYTAVKNKVLVHKNVNETIDYIKSQIQNPQSQIVLLASGDPLFSGIGRRVAGELGKDAVEILPDISSIQAAFASVKESWDDAFLMSLHGGPDPEKRRRLPYEITDIPSLLQRHNKIAILTDKENNPAAIAKELLKPSTMSYQLSAIKIHVCERLGYDEERIVSGAPDEIASQSFKDPNVVIIQWAVSRQASAVRFGLTEDEIAHSRGLITKDEARAAAIHKLRLPEKGVLWDIGAGSGSVSIEAALLYPELKIFAVEKNEEQIKNINSNISNFGIANIEAIKGEAPHVLKGLPSPDRVFIGGSGGRLEEIVNIISQTKAEIVVINSATIETLNSAVSFLERAGFKIEASQVSVSRMKNIGEGKFFSALNPVFIIKGER
jgi:precorrin-6Y C5,15-methyltransferase (decarboxylating)